MGIHFLKLATVLKNRSRRSRGGWAGGSYGLADKVDEGKTGKRIYAP
jgi:hypothetical protein